MATTRTAGEASKMLADYEHMNPDLEDPLRRQLAIFVIAPLVGLDALESLFKRPLGQTPFRHRSWMWYTALRTSGMGQHWDVFADRHNQGQGIRAALEWLRSRVSEEAWKTLGRRTFRRDGYLSPSDWSYGDGTPSQDYWTRGGTWNLDNNLTKIIVFGKHIHRDDYDYNILTEALGSDGARTLERELYNLIDEDKSLVPNAKYQAVDYARRRIPDLAGWKNTPNASYQTVSWFFQEPIPEPSTPYFYDWRWPHEERRRFISDGSQGRVEYWDWLPPLEDEDE